MGESYRKDSDYVKELERENEELRARVKELEGALTDAAAALIGLGKANGAKALIAIRDKEKETTNARRTP